MVLKVQTGILLLFMVFYLTTSTKFCEKRFDSQIKVLELVESQLEYLWAQLDLEITQAHWGQFPILWYF